MTSAPSSPRSPIPSARSYAAGAFSFNVPGGRCDVCEGDGTVTVEMQFLADIELPCEECNGTRYKAGILEIKYKNKNIYDVLNMTVKEALVYFAGHPRIVDKLYVLDEVGLSYVRLGQSATTLSGGEAQRVKLASHLATARSITSRNTNEAAAKARSRTLYILDEPTTGLHFDDVAKLLAAFRKLIEGGGSLARHRAQSRRHQIRRLGHRHGPRGRRRRRPHRRGRHPRRDRRQPRQPYRPLARTAAGDRTMNRAIRVWPTRPLSRAAAVATALLLCAPPSRTQDFSANLTQTPPPSPQRQQADAALQAHDFPLALKLLTPLVAASPKDAHLLYDLGAAQDALDQNSAAEQTYRAAIADDPLFLDPHVALGLLLARAARFDDAHAELLKASALPAGDPALKARAYRALARIDQKLHPAVARDELLEALKLSPETSEDTLLAAELALSASGGGPAAEAAYRHVLALHPEDPSATAGLAKLLVQSKRTPEAETLLTSALAVNPSNPALTVQLASLYHTAGELEKSVSLVEALHKTLPQNVDVTHLLAGLYLDMQDYALAEPLLASLAIQRPQETSIMDDRARALLHLKRFPEAQGILARIVAQPSLFPTPADLGNAAGDLAFACSENNDPAGALQALDVRAKVLPPSPQSLFLAAISHDKLKHVKLAEQAYKEFLAASNGSLPDQEFEAQHRLVALEHTK